MAISFVHPRPHIVDGNGNPYPGAKLYFYDPGTTTARTVYQDASLTQPHTQPIIADAAGRWATIYLPSGAYKARCETSTGVLIYEQDNCDPGLATGPGALPIASGGTGATNAIAALSNLGGATADDLAALQTEFNTLKSIVDPSIVEAGDRLGTLAGLDDIRVEDVGSEFKTILIKDAYNSIISVSSGAGVWNYDNTTPQIGEGNQAWSGSFTPTRSDTIVRVSVDAVVGSASGNAGIALFDSGPDCLVFTPAGQASGGQSPGYARAVIELPSWGANVAKSFVLRYGGYSGTSYFNSGTLGSSMGGSYRSSVLFEEIKRS